MIDTLTTPLIQSKKPLSCCNVGSMNESIGLVNNVSTRQKLIVLSADALVYEDLAYLETLPNFRKYLSGGCRIERVRSIYPTITYPCHATMATGVYPNKHGLAGNLCFIPGDLNPPWHWFYDELKFKESIFKSAKQAGYSTAAVYWPSTGCNPYIDYLIDEYWTQGPADSIPEAYARSGSSEEVLEIIRKNMDGVVLRSHPGSDEFAMNCAIDILRSFAPDLLMIHPANIDGLRHKTGVFTAAVQEEVARTDGWIGRIMEAVAANGDLENTNFVLTSDHGQLNTVRTVNLNVFFADKGLISVGPDGSLTDWQAYCLSGGLSALVYLKDSENQALYQSVYSLLRQMADDGIYGISQVFTREEYRKEHLDGDFSFVLESDGYTSFGDRWIRPIVLDRNNSTDYRYGRATHGHLPEKGPQPVFVARGPAFRENVILPSGRLVDEAPTLAAVLGVQIPGADGNVIYELLK